MARRFDVAARLTEGLPAVEHTQTYVQACQVLGYQHPDLTTHGSQVRDRYETETGLDLEVLDDDCAELRAAVTAIEEAVWLQRSQTTELATAWAGQGADSAARFLQRHCDAAAEVAAHVRAAADGCAVLRDNLWSLVDGKAATAVAIDDRRLADRSAWLAAAHTVMTGVGDRSAAEELVRQQVTPYVDNDIRTDWLTAMRSTATSVAASYDMAIESLTSAPAVHFEIPGDLGPKWEPVFDEPLRASSATPTMPEVSLPADVVPTMPAAVSVPPPPPPEAPPSPAALDNWPSVPSELAAPLGDATGLSSGAGDLGSLGSLAGSIGGVIGSIVNGIGGLLGSLAGGLAGPSGSGDSLLDDPLDADDLLGDGDEPAENVDDDDTDDAEPVSAEQDADAETPSVADDSADVPAAEPVNPPPTDPSPPAEAAPVAPPPVPSPPVSEPSPEESTPCEIAADELPQAGQ